jgi:hypothetical protein
MSDPLVDINLPEKKHLLIANNSADDSTCMSLAKLATRRSREGGKLWVMKTANLEGPE